MARAKPGAKKERWVYKWTGHVEHYFNADQVQEAIEYMDQRTLRIHEVLEILTQKEIQCKFAYSEDTDSFRMVLQPKSRNHPYVGLTIGFSHVNLERLAKLALYVSDCLLDNEALDLPTKRVQNDW